MSDTKTDLARVIGKLRAENTRLRKALQTIRDATPLDGESFVCDFATLQSVAQIALLDTKP